MKITENPAGIRPRVALNPIQWIATADGWIDPTLAPEPRNLLAEVAETGFRAIHAQVPAGWRVSDYARVLAETGLEPAPGYLALGLPEHGMSRAEAVEAARIAAALHAGLGLQDMFISTRMLRDVPRVLHPAIGAAFDEARFAAIISLMDEVSVAIRAEGIYPALHPHVGTWIETETETRRVLDALPASQIGFGPDTGHLSWAGADIAALLADYRDRVRVMHVKDCLLSRCREAVAANRSYRDTVVGGIWAEPGHGELGLDAMIAGTGARL